jgi:DNA-binding NarL/FixJ family response regulator
MCWTVFRDEKGKGHILAHRKQILVLESEKLLAASILSLLESRSEFDVTSTTVSSLACMDQADSPGPDVVILEEELLAANILAVVKLAEQYPELRLIVIGPKTNKLHVFDKQIVQVRQVSDFLKLL